MPGRARGQLLALDEHAVGPTLLREMIECRDADYAPANHHCPRVRSHSHPLELRTSQPIIVDTRSPRPTDSITVKGGTPMKTIRGIAVLSCLMIVGAAHGDCLKGNAGIPPGANTTDPS